jgi:hypothetical protein
LIETYFRGNDFATIKIVDQKIFDENYWLKPIPAETILQPLKIFDQKLFDDNFWFKPIPEEMI